MAHAEYGILGLDNVGALGFNELLQRASVVLADASDIRERLKASLSLSESLRRLGRLDIATGVLNQACRIAYSGEMQSELGWLLWAKANLLRQSGHNREFLHYLVQAADIANRCKDLTLYSYSRAGIGEWLRIRGSFKNAFALHKECQGYFSEKRDVRGIIWSKQGIAQMWKKDQKPHAAYKEFLIANAMSEDIGDIRSLAYSVKGLGETLGDSGDLDGATQLLQRASKLFHQIGLHVGEGYVLKSLSDIEWQRGDFESALTGYETANSLFKLSGHKRGHAYVTLGIGVVLGKIGKYEQSECKLRNAVSQFEAIGILGGRREAEKALENLHCG